MSILVINLLPESVHADKSISSSTIQVSAVVEPVTEIVVDKNNNISEIYSNNHQRFITPIVYKNSLKGTQTFLSHRIKTQYVYDLSHYAPLNNYGLIYKLNFNNNKKIYISTIIARLASIYSIENLIL
jgi:hypothetical protein